MFLERLKPLITGTIGQTALGAMLGMGIYEGGKAVVNGVTNAWAERSATTTHSKKKGKKKSKKRKPKSKSTASNTAPATKSV